MTTLFQVGGSVCMGFSLFFSHAAPCRFQFFNTALHILGAIVIAAIVVAALAIIGGSLDREGNNNEEIIPRH